DPRVVWQARLIPADPQGELPFAEPPRPEDRSSETAGNEPDCRALPLPPRAGAGPEPTAAAEAAQLPPLAADSAQHPPTQRKSVVPGISPGALRVKSVVLRVGGGSCAASAGDEAGLRALQARVARSPPQADPPTAGEV